MPNVVGRNVPWARMNLCDSLFKLVDKCRATVQHRIPAIGRREAMSRHSIKVLYNLAQAAKQLHVVTKSVNIPII